VVEDWEGNAALALSSSRCGRRKLGSCTFEDHEIMTASALGNLPRFGPHPANHGQGYRDEVSCGRETEVREFVGRHSKAKKEIT
jgi:hypothetical protein